MKERILKELERRIDVLEKQLNLVESYSVQSFWSAIDRIYEHTLIGRVITCIVCSYSTKREKYEVKVDHCQFAGGILERYKCPRCGCIFGPQKYLDMERLFIDNDYGLLYSRYSESNSYENELKTFHSLSPKKTKLYLNWGCGGHWSSTVQKLRDGGWNVWGFEPSLQASEGFIVKSREEISAKFDGIFSNNVIEHFRNPVRQFLEFHKMLKPNGLMAHSSPCYEQKYMSTRFHTLFLLGKSAHVLAEMTGFKVKGTSSVGDYTNYIFEKCQLDFKTKLSYN